MGISDTAFNEMRADGAVRDGYRALDRWLAETPAERLAQRRDEADRIFRRRGITFAVYGDTSGAERLIPFDVIPRVLARTEWDRLSAGCIQRVKALNMFLEDVYGPQEILKAGKIPAQEILGNALYLKEAVGLCMPLGVHSHISGVDVVRTAPEQWYVLEDNLRTPSGVSYMIENRAAMQRLFPELFRSNRVAPVGHYPDLLRETLRSVAPPGVDHPNIVVLTPGSLNSAYFEHGFLAARMGARLVEGQDLYVENDRVYMKETTGPTPVHVIYRRIDDDFLDPEAFKPESVLGVKGLLRAIRAGNVTVTNAIGNGVADDKATYFHVPAMIRFYLGEEPILSNVPTWRCRDKADLAYVLEHLAELVVKEVHGSGGYGMLVGPTATKAQVAAFAEKLKEKPDGYIAQPTLALSTCPTFVENGVAPRHVDLRPYVLAGKSIELVPGALTRVALKEGSLVVNSSQGGGTKDTWVVEGETAPC
ncbi:MAG: circularly permuted type 2 ATP-grasp protein [Planctomycetes bacterium]|nr:circularly permuted type 2 ATP-grasp protein [Planctomycetota bacterium]